MRVTLQRGVRLLEAGDFEGAEALFGEACAAWPEASDAWHLRGVAAFRRGELTAARRFIDRAIELAGNVPAYFVNLGNVARADGDLAGAVAALERALQVAPADVAALCNLGGVLGAQGDLDKAADMYRRAIAADAGLGEAYQGLSWALATAGASPQDVYRDWLAAVPDDPVARWLAGADPSPAAIARYFDRFAPTYDETLDALDYGVPALIAELLPVPTGAWDVLDAGCGTGRAGPLLRPWARHLTGVDLSPAMVSAAATSGAYDELLVDDVATVLSHRRYDLVFAADVVPYLRDPSPLFAGPRIAFSAELAAEGTVRRPSGRYAHSEARLRELLAPALEVTACKTAVLRTEGGAPVHGLLVIACNDRG